MQIECKESYLFSYLLSPSSNSSLSNSLYHKNYEPTARRFCCGFVIFVLFSAEHLCFWLNIWGRFTSDLRQTPFLRVSKSQKALIYKGFRGFGVTGQLLTSSKRQLFSSSPIFSFYLFFELPDPFLSSPFPLISHPFRARAASSDLVSNLKIWREFPFFSSLFFSFLSSQTGG